MGDLARPPSQGPLGTQAAPRGSYGTPASLPVPSGGMLRRRLGTLPGTWRTEDRCPGAERGRAWGGRLGRITRAPLPAPAFYLVDTKVGIPGQTLISFCLVRGKALVDPGAALTGLEDPPSGLGLGAKGAHRPLWLLSHSLLLPGLGRWVSCRRPAWRRRQATGHQGAGGVQGLFRGPLPVL